MAQQWHYAINGKEHGPVSAGELKQLAAAGKLKPSDQVWQEGMSDWADAGTVKGLFPNRPPANGSQFSFSPEPDVPDEPAPLVDTSEPRRASRREPAQLSTAEPAARTHRKPMGVVATAIASALCAIFCLAGMAAFSVAGTVSAELSRMHDEDEGFAKSIGVGIAATIIGAEAIALATASYGLLTRQRWAPLLTKLAFGVIAAIGLLQFYRSPAQGVPTVMLAAAVLAYLILGDARDHFDI